MTDTNDSYHHGNLRENLIDIAIDILATEGMGGIKMREIGRRAGVSQSAAYRHFSDKSALLAAVAQRGFDELANHLQAVREADHESPDLKLAQMGQTYVVYAIEHAAQYRLMYGTDAARQEDHPELAESARNMARKFYRVVKRSQEAGLCKGETPDEIIRTIWSSAHGAAMLVIDGFITPDDPAEFARGIVDHVSYGIKK